MARWPLRPFKEELATYWAAYDDRENNPLEVVVYGNSITNGFPADREGGWPSYLGERLNKKIGLQHGAGFVDCAIGANALFTLTNTSGNSLTSQIEGLGAWTVKLMPGDLLNVTLPFDRLGVFYKEVVSGGGEFTVKVDSVLEATIDVNAGVEMCDQEHVLPDTYTIEDHDVEIENTHATLPVYISGVFAYMGNFDAGWRIFNGAHDGTWGAYPHVGTMFTGQSPKAYFDIIERRQPALVIWAHFFNDRHFTPAQRNSWLADTVAEIRARSPNTSILFASEYATAGYDGGDMTAVEMEAQNVAAAETYGCGYLNTSLTWGSLGDNGVEDDPFNWLGSDQTHPEEAGYEKFTDIYFNFLNGMRPPFRTP